MQSCGPTAIRLLVLCCPLCVLAGATGWRQELEQAESYLALRPPNLHAALPLLVNVMKRKPKHKDTRVNLANVYSELNMPTKAEKHIRKLAKLSRSGEERSGALYMLAKHHLRAKAPQETIVSALRGAYDEDSTNDNAKHWLAHQLSRSPNGEREAADLLASIRLDQLTDNHPLDTLMLLGQAKERLGELVGAVQAFRQACGLYRQEEAGSIEDKIRFRYGLSHFQLVRLLLLTNKAEEALQVGLWGQKEFPPVYQLTDAVSVALAANGRSQDALENYKMHRMRMPLTFLRDYASRNRPVIIRNCSGNSLIDDWPARKRWRKEEFLRQFGEHTIQARKSSVVAFDNEFGGMQRQNMTVAEYIHGWSMQRAEGSTPSLDLSYLLQNRALPIRDDYTEPSVFVHDTAFAHNASARDQIALFYFGPAMSGVSLHQHTNAWNALVYGAKQWFLFPPYAMYGPTGMPMTQWLDDFYPQLKESTQVFECTQYPGDVLYVPTDWYHGVINLKDSIGVASEFGHHRRLLEIGERGASDEVEVAVPSM
eukprot:g1949.t1